jgi:hypothetical protein
MQSLAAGGLDWLRVMEVALEQYVLPLVSANFAAADSPVAPREWSNGFRIRFDRIARRNLYLSTHLLSILDSFQSAGVTAIPYKGPVLTAQAYGDLALRTFDDLDFLVPHRELARAYNSLCAHGFVPETSQDAIAEGRQAPGQYLFQKDHGQCVVEIHTERTLRYYPKPLDVDRLLSRVVHIPFCGRRVPTFAAEDLLMLLSVHASKHFWDRLLWVCDVAELVQAQDRFDWDLALDTAQRHACERMVLLGASLAAQLVEAPVPESVVRRANEAPHVRELGRRVATSLFRDETAVLGLASRFAFRMRLSQSPLMGLRYCLRLLTSPTQEDRAQTPWATGRLTPVQRALRPFHLLRKYGSGLVRRPAPDLAPFVASPPEFVEAMLALAELQPGDVLFDLGCGEGDIVIAAARRYGIRCVGVDLNPSLLRRARAKSREAGVGDLVRFIRADAKSVPLSGASVVTLYLVQVGVLKLERRLRTELRPGARVISRDAPMGGWPPERIVEIPGSPMSTIYRWTVDASAASSAA